MSGLVVGGPCEVRICIGGGAGRASLLLVWSRGFVVKEIGPVIKVLDLRRGHLANYPPTHVREAAR